MMIVFSHAPSMLQACSKDARYLYLHQEISKQGKELNSTIYVISKGPTVAKRTHHATQGIPT